jgi:hypothetical protein
LSVCSPDHNKLTPYACLCCNFKHSGGGNPQVNTTIYRKMSNRKKKSLLFGSPIFCGSFCRQLLYIHIIQQQSSAMQNFSIKITLKSGFYNKEKVRVAHRPNTRGISHYIVDGNSTPLYIVFHKVGAAHKLIGDFINGNV